MKIEEAKRWLRRNWDVYIWLPLAGLLFYYSQPILSFFSPTGAAGTFDGGILQPLLLSVISLLVIVGVVVLVMKIRFPAFLEMMESKARMCGILKYENEKQSGWQLLVLFFGLASLLVALTGLYLLAGS